MKRPAHRRTAPPLKLPHERDQSVEVAAVLQNVIRRAARDLAADLVATDNYTRASATTGVAAKRRRLKA